MSNERLKNLLSEFCTATGMADPEWLYESGHLKVDGFEVALFYEELVDPEAIYIYIDFGTVAEDKQRSVYRKMLESNLTSGHVGVLGVHPDTGHATFSARLLMESLTGAELASMLGRYVDHAKTWRENTPINATPVSNGAAGLTGIRA